MESHNPRTTSELIRRYDVPGPRYTSYPTAVSFHEGFDEAAYRERLALADARSDAPLSLYAHLPFCEARCLYCGCNVVISPHREVAQPYLEHILRELELLAAALPHRRRLSQMQWGGGTPTYYGTADLARLFTAIQERFTFTENAEIGIEVDLQGGPVGGIDVLREHVAHGLPTEQQRQDGVGLVALHARPAQLDPGHADREREGGGAALLLERGKGPAEGLLVPAPAQFGRPRADPQLGADQTLFPAIEDDVLVFAQEMIECGRHPGGASIA